MSDEFHDRARLQEDEYFRRKDLELLEKIRQAAAAKAAQSALGDAAGVTDPAIVDQLKALGFTPDTVVLLPLVPAVQVAWAEGGITAHERSALLKLAAARGISDGTAAHQQLTSWMAERPADAVFAGANRLIGAMLASHAKVVDGLSADDLVRFSESVASASGGIFGFVKISAEERQILADLAASIAGKRQ